MLSKDDEQAKEAIPDLPDARGLSGAVRSNPEPFGGRSPWQRRAAFLI
jgi:hypothetical protein